MGVGDGLGRAGGAGGEDEISEPVGVAHRVGTRRVVHQCGEIAEDWARHGGRQRHAGPREDRGRRDKRGDPVEFWRGQPLGGGHRHETCRDTAEECHGELGRVAEPDEYSVTGGEALGRQRPRHAEDGGLEPREAPAFGAGRAEDGERDLVRGLAPFGQDVIGKVERRRTGLHPHGLTRPPAALQAGAGRAIRRLP